MDKEKIFKAIQDFHINYDSLFDNLKVLKSNEKIYVGEKNNSCRFCGRTDKEVTFKQVAHAIPESLGNKQIICLDECDECNKFFSENLEDSLDKITLPYRTTNFIKGKKKVPTFKTIDKKARIDVKDPKVNFMKVTAREDSSFLEFDDEKKTATMKFKLQPHIPAAAYKTLVKMALSVIGREQLLNFKYMTQWILSKDHCKPNMKPLKVLFTFIPGINPFRKTLVFLFRKKETRRKEYPKYTFILAFGNILYQIVIPDDEEILKRNHKITFLKFMTPFDIEWFLGDPIYKILDWTNCEVLRDKKEIITFSYDEKIKVDPNVIDKDSISI